MLTFISEIQYRRNLNHRSAAVFHP